MNAERKWFDMEAELNFSAIKPDLLEAVRTVAGLVKDAGGRALMVGGAVLTEEYAAEIHADYYSRDAMGAVRTAEEVFA